MRTLFKRHGADVADGPAGQPPDLPLRVKDLTVAYRQRSLWHTAVADVSISLKPGDYLGVVGESGCGKSTLVHAVLGLLPANAKVRGGSIRISGHEIVGIDEERFRSLRWREASVVLQSGMNALNPLLTVRDQFRDLYKAHGYKRHGADEPCAALLERVRVPAARARAYPHQLSGGMRQRVCIALALALNPKLIVLDEPTTALDVVVQREIFDLIDELREERGFAVLLVSHDLALVVERADRVAVMYAGRIVEMRPSAQMTTGTTHPYTAGLFAASPRLGERHGPAEVIPGAPPRLGHFPAGCAFHPRCPNCTERCRTEVPPLERDESGELACFHPVQVGAGTPAGPMGAP
jgi:oligopeptide/dipeptide ABC transporter ATP-binding protein